MNQLNDPWMLLVLALSVLVLSAFRYERWALPLVLGTTLWAGMDVAYNSSLLMARWAALGFAAAGGVLLWLSNRRRLRFGAVHLLTFWTAINIVLSAGISVNPTLTLLKGATVLALLVFATVGARLVLAGHEERMERAWLLAAEAVTYTGAFFYWVLGQRIFGHDNSLGAIVGILVVPILVWTALSAPTASRRRRATVALVLAAILLILTIARAAYLAGAVATFVVLFGLRRDRLLIPAAVLLAFSLAVVAANYPTVWEGLIDAVYKKREGLEAPDDLLDSRREGWQESFDLIRDSPWVGIGFGVTPGLSDTWEIDVVGSGFDRERGNSYLGLVEGIGFFGTLPFAAMLILLVRLLWRGTSRLRRSTRGADIAVPLAAATAAALVHAVFEAWLFAAGYYVTAAFWVLAFWFVDREHAIRQAQIPQRGTVNRRVISAA